YFFFALAGSRRAIHDRFVRRRLRRRVRQGAPATAASTDALTLTASPGAMKPREQEEAHADLQGKPWMTMSIS
ncbi:MAG: hypothetical protein ACREUF_01280, partial [Solimonas sp.]